MSSRPFDRGRGRGGGRGRGDVDLPFRGRGGPRGGGGGLGRGRGGVMEQSVFTQGTGAPAQPDQKVERIEKETEKAGQLRRRPGTVDATLPHRPGYGTRGKPITLFANYFQLLTPSGLLLYRYGIEITPVGSARQPVGKKVKRIIQLLMEEHFATEANSIATDYKSNMVSSVRLPLDEDIYVIRYRSEDEDESGPSADNYRLHIQATGTLMVSELIEHLTSTQASGLLGSKEETIQALNIVLGHHPKTVRDIVSVGANKHFEISAARRETMSLGAGLQAMRGFFVSVRAATARLLINVQVKHGAFYMEGPLEYLMDEFVAQNGRNMGKLEKFLERVRVRVTHIKRKNKAGKDIPRIKTIAKLAMPSDGRGLQHPPIVPRFAAGSRDVKFFNDTTDQPQSPSASKGKKSKKPIQQGPKPRQDDYISVYDFFRSRHNITIREPNKPVVNVGTPQNPSYLPADVCEVLPGQPSGTKLSPTQTQQMIRFAVRRPAQNAHSIVVNGARVLGIEPPTNAVPGDFDMQVIPRLITVPGRVLTGPEVKYKNSAARATFGSWNLQPTGQSGKPQQFSTTAAISSWTYLYLRSERERNTSSIEQALNPALNAFQSKLRNLGVQVADCTPGMHIDLPDSDKNSNHDELIDITIHKFTSHSTRPPPSLLFVILPYIDDPIYNRIKWLCDVKYGLRNICVLGSKFVKERNDQYFANVALKVNLKFGGRNQSLEPSKVGIIAEGKTMVVGMDVTHPSPGSSSKAPSVASIVASVDQWLGQWPADLRIQKSRQEMVADLDGMLKSRLHLWAMKNQKRYPENILVYRDGVSEGQYDLVLNEELPLLRKACQETYPADLTKKGLPRMTIIIVGKRHNTRFYVTRPEDADRSSNTPSGTVVDRGITEAPYWDFYMQAHTALQGTARPAHYYVILDEIFQAHPVKAPFRHAADVLEDLTHNMCYLYGRATKAVSICPPAYYADLVCERGRKYLSRLFDASPGATPAGSVTQGGGGGGGQGVGADPSEVRLHPNVRDSMFYL